MTDDRNADGTIDQWEFHNVEGVLVRGERDLDFDGDPDFFEHYDSTGTQVIEDELELDFDDLIDSVRYYDRGVLIRREISIGFDGFFSVTKCYDSQGQVTTLERDTDLDGTPDLREYYQDGQVVESESLEDDEGRPDCNP